MRWQAALAVVLLVLMASAAVAQRGGLGRRGGGFVPRPLHYATLDDFDGSFQFCRLVFRRASDGDGGGWNADFPRADENLSIRLSELTNAPVGMGGDEIPKHLLVTLRDPSVVSHCPFIMMTEVGALYLDEGEAAALRDYLLRGGFLWADDFWGEYAWEFFENQMRKVLPSREYPIVNLPIEHPIFHSQMSVTAFPQIPSINFWGGPGGRTSERGRESATPHARAVLDQHGRIMVFITHNTDFGDAFEREGDSHAYFVEFSVQGHAIGINVLLYAMTH